MADMPKVVTATVAARFAGLSESTLAKLRLNGNGMVTVRSIASWDGGLHIALPTWSSGSSHAPRATRRMPTRDFSRR